MVAGLSPGVGIIFKIGSDVVADVLTVGGPDYSTTQIQTTSLDVATGSHFHTYMQGINDGGNVDLQVQLDADNVGQAALLTEVESDVGSALLSYTLTLKDSGTANSSNWVFNGIITKFDVGGMDIDGIVVADITIKVSGKPAYTAGS